LFLDISAAFDVLDHHALLERAEDLCGITVQVLLWLSSFLTGRQSFVSVGDYGSCTTSHHFPTKHGVPQGSTLGPIFFAMNVAPLEQVVFNNGARCHEYADDTQLYMRLTPGPNTLGDLGKCVDCVACWFLLNSLMVNPSKTVAILFGTTSRVKTNACSDPELIFVGVKVPIFKSIRILGVTLDSSLSFDKHVTKTLSNCNIHFRALRHVHSSLTTKAAIAIACSLINTRLDYCNSLLFNTAFLIEYLFIKNAACSK